MEQKANTKPGLLYLIDGSSYIYRAYFAIRQHLTTHTGFPTKAIYGVTNMLLKVLREKDPKFISMLWDAKGPTFRHEIYEQYKANRPPMPDDLSVQIPYIRDVVDALGLPQLEKEGFEADDLVATIVKKLPDIDILIVTGDKDLSQLLSPRVSIWDPMKDEYTDLAKFKKDFGIEPAQLLDVMALAGDTADNIPGVPGIGPKTALKLIKEFGSLQKLLKNIDNMPKTKLRQRLLEHRDKILLWRKLIMLNDNVPIEVNLDDFRRHPMNIKRLRELFKELEFTTFLKELSPEKTINFDDYKLVDNEEDLTGLAEQIKAKGEMVLDTETTSEFPMYAKLVGVSVCASPPQAAYIPVAHETTEKQLDVNILKRIIGPLLSDKSIKKIGQNIKYDMIVLSNHGMELEGIEGDTMIASYLLNPSKHQHNLSEIASEVLGHNMISFKEVTANQKKEKNFAYVPLELAKNYSCEDVHVTALVKDILWERLKNAHLWDLFQKIEVPLITVLAKMEKKGVLIDKKGLSALELEFTHRIEEIKNKIFDYVGHEFNLNSPKQLAHILFEKFNLPQQKKTKKKTGFSTDIEVLSSLSKIHDLPAMILEYRNLQKLKSTYVEGLKKMLHPLTGRVHTSFNQTVTATGRLSSSDPNLQNIPIRTEEGRRIRALFIADPGHYLVSGDYSQIDLRVLAHYSKDETLVKAFRKGEDIHQKTAAEVFDIPPEMVTPEMRRIAKTVNFGIIYGMSPYGLAKELGIEQKKAREYIKRYFERYPGVKKYMEKTVEKARKQGFVTTLLGRRRYIPDIVSRSRRIREFAERTAINTPIQGSAADIIKLAMLAVDKALGRGCFKSALILQVHDELVLEVPETELDQVRDLLKHTMENVVALNVPLTVSIKYGLNWAEIEEV